MILPSDCTATANVVSASIEPKSVVTLPSPPKPGSSVPFELPPAEIALSTVIVTAAVLPDWVSIEPFAVNATPLSASRLRAPPPVRISASTSIKSAVTVNAPPPVSVGFVRKLTASAPPWPLMVKSAENPVPSPVTSIASAPVSPALIVSAPVGLLNSVDSPAVEPTAVRPAPALAIEMLSDAVLKFKVTSVALIRESIGSKSA